MKVPEADQLHIGHVGQQNYAARAGGGAPHGDGQEMGRYGGGGGDAVNQRDQHHGPGMSHRGQQQR